jgi:hypothetical protein
MDKKVLVIPQRGNQSSEDGVQVQAAMGLNLVTYHLWPPVWILERLAPIDEPEFEVERLSEVVYTKTLQSGITVSVQRQGMFRFDFQEWRTSLTSAKGIRETMHHVSKARTDIINAQLACLYSAMEELQPVPSKLAMAGHPKMWATAQDLALSRVEKPNEAVLGDTSLLAFSQADKRRSYVGKPGHDWRHIGRVLVVEKNTLDLCFDKFNVLLTSPVSDLSSIVSTYQQATVSYEAEAYGTALALAWTVTERVVGVLWDRYLERNRRREYDGQQKTFINGKRKDFLAEQLSASAIIEFLSLLEELPFPLYEASQKPRKARNKWMHQMQPPSPDEALNAIGTAADFLQFLSGVALHSKLITFPRS